MATAAAASPGGLCSGLASLSVRPRRVLTRPAAAFRTLSCNQPDRTGHPVVRKVQEEPGYKQHRASMFHFTVRSLIEQNISFHPSILQEIGCLEDCPDKHLPYHHYIAVVPYLYVIDCSESHGPDLLQAVLDICPASSLQWFCYEQTA